MMSYPTQDLSEEESARGSSLNWPTVLASAGIAAVVSALIVTIGVVGMFVADNRGGVQNAAAQPTVVNLGAPTQQAAAAPAAPGAAATSSAPAGDAPAAAPTEAVAPAAGEQTPTAAAPAPGQQTSAQQNPAQQPAAPAALSAAQLTTKVKLAMNTGASRASRAAELQGGQQALTSVDAVARLLAAYPDAGFSYQVVGPVAVNGTTQTAQLQMSLVGNGSRYKPMKWIWLDGKWKLSNESVCVIAAYAMVPCSV